MLTRWSVTKSLITDTITRFKVVKISSYKITDFSVVVCKFSLFLKKISEMEKNFSLRDLNTFGFDVKARYFQEIKSMDDILECRATVSRLNGNTSRILILSGGSNILFSSEV